jgi:hypothetical protein
MGEDYGDGFGIALAHLAKTFGARCAASTLPLPLSLARERCPISTQNIQEAEYLN